MSVAIDAKETEIKAIIAGCNEQLQDNVQKAVGKLVELALDDTIDPKHQLKAIDMILVRVLGKPPDKVEIKSGAPWEAAIAAALVTDVIDVQVVEPKKTKKKKKKKKLLRVEE